MQADFEIIYLSLHEKTNNLGSNQVRHKPGCTVTEDGKLLEILDLEGRVTMKLICAFGFAYADCWSFHAAAHFAYKIFKI